MRPVVAYSILAAVPNEALWSRSSRRGRIILEADGPHYQGDFLSLVEDFYHMEYVYSILKTRPFSGIAKRKEAILRRVQFSFHEIADELIELFAHIFQDWLDAHTLTDAKMWAEKRVGYNTSKTNPYTLWNRYFREYRDLAIHVYKIDKETFEERLLQELQQSYPDLFSETSVLPGIKDIVDVISPEKYPLFVQQSFQKSVFPLWVQDWTQVGLGKTRDLVEAAYSMLLDAKTVEERSVAVNHALNVSHQNGKMLDYVEEATGIEDLKTFFDSMSEGRFTSQMDAVLKALGFKL